jgi:hypothetical protein
MNAKDGLDPRDVFINEAHGAYNDLQAALQAGELPTDEAAAVIITLEPVVLKRIAGDAALLAESRELALGILATARATESP